MAEGLNRNMKCMTQQAYARNATAPAIMERASTAAYQEPSVAIVKPSVAKATDGAAPNSPAKLLGLRVFPKVANAETKRPPTKNRNKSDLRIRDLPILTRAFGSYQCTPEVRLQSDYADLF